jgi:hypothetical protein
MKRLFVGFTVAAFVVALGVPAFAKTETIKGQIVDESCYKMDKSNTGVDHKMPKGDTKDCAIGCAKAGRPMAWRPTRTRRSSRTSATRSKSPAT